MVYLPEGPAAQQGATAGAPGMCISRMSARLERIAIARWLAPPKVVFRFGSAPMDCFRHATERRLFRPPTLLSRSRAGLTGLISLTLMKAAILSALDMIEGAWTGLRRRKGL